jgi:heme exporter protein CcmD
MSLHDFIAMGGYGAYIWSCYGLTLAIVVWNIVSARRDLNEQIAAARRRTQTGGGQ